MIPSITKNDLIATLLQIRSSTSATIPLNSNLPKTEFKQGEKYPVLVEARLPNNNAQILIADKQLQIRLPDIFQPGTKLTLMVASVEPQLKFTIVNEAQLKTQDEHTLLSATGRFLGNLAQDLLKNQNPNNTQTIVSQTPVIADTNLNNTELPSLLQKTIAQSGLFYESHQAKWINGENTLENLRQEPQNKIATIASESSTLKMQTTTQLHTTDLSIPSQAISLVSQQLSTLETGHIIWRGIVWENQLMDWDIHEEKQGDKENESEHLASWDSQIRLSLPNLGEILIKMSLYNHNIEIKINALQPETSCLLKNNQHPLASEMHASGINIQSIKIQSHDDGT
ncbi:hook-length control protein FliK [Nitrosomonas sp. PY1]|uniref:flagellar hook-length control protein FliK n=1 Tax=Nitrosomonas sp. PY1 TaxID=1803906 RepID=UPI001FC7F7FF|nr:flagellar hook-length control protein FliK [Nitrosomonas sp. PY1]GKS68294.1 hook-length control protein FliK [Nitrosomonas sp. PY1]